MLVILKKYAGISVPDINIPFRDQTKSLSEFYLMLVLVGFYTILILSASKDFLSKTFVWGCTLCFVSLGFFGFKAVKNFIENDTSIVNYSYDQASWK